MHEKIHLVQNPRLLLGGVCYSEGCYWEGPLYQHVIHDPIFRVFLTYVKINA